MILRRDERRRGWFWTSREEDDLDEMEDEAERTRWGATSTARMKRRKSGLTMRVIWLLLTSIRRAMVDLSVGMMIALVGVIVIGGGWRRARYTLAQLRGRFARFIANS